MAQRTLAEVLAGAVVLAAAAGFLAYALAHSGRVGGAGYLLHARFDHIDGLGDGADVRLAGVRIGTVTGAVVDPRTYLADVTMRVSNAIRLPRDTSAAITTASLLGGQYISLSPGGSAHMLKPGGTITATQGAISLEQLLGKFIFSVTNMVNAVKPPAGGAPPGK